MNNAELLVEIEKLLDRKLEEKLDQQLEVKLEEKLEIGRASCRERV